MYVYCVESFAHIECYSDCSCRGAIWLNPFATVLFSVCSAVTVECCVLRVLHGCVWYVCCYVGRSLLSNVIAITGRYVVWACMRYPCLCLCGFWDRDYVSQLPCARFLLRAVLNILVRNASPRRPVCFRCPIFSF